MPELDKFEVGKTFADMAQSLVIELVGVEVDVGETGPAAEFRECVSSNGGAAEGEFLQVLQTCKLLESGVGGFAEVGQLEFGEPGASRAEVL